MRYQMSNVLVTGGAGFIGSHIAERALELGNNVYIIDDLSSGKIDNIPKGAHFIKADINNFNWETILFDIDYIIHCAAFVSAPESFEKFEICYQTNVLATWKLLQAAIKYKIKKILFCSSSAVYADIKDPNKETDYPCPANPYGLTKLDVEYLLNMMYIEYGLKYTAFRYFNVYGPKQDVNSIYSAVIPIFITRALDNKDLIIYGTGQQRRDFIYVKDVAKTVLSFMNNDIVGYFNLGTGKDISLIELAEIVINNTNSSSKIIFDKPRPGDVMFSCANIEKLLALGFGNNFINFNDGIKKTIAFYENNKI